MTVQVFVTVGTSALTKFPPNGWQNKEKDLIKKLRQGNNEFFKSCKQDMIGKVTRILNSYGDKADTRGFERYTAELGSLLAMKRQENMLDNDPANNHIILLHTDTAEGQLCAEVLKEVIEKTSGNAALADKVQFKRIDSLSAENPENFETGLKKLQELVQTCCKESPDSNKIFNITGGYKGLIPYATLLAWDFNMLVCYLYEQSKELIKIYRPLEPWKPIFSEVVAKTTFPSPKKKVRALLD
ncbi:MAG: putative CRISPR-associated protein [Desulfobacca sp.]|nr:putative CRISPR-associated protein [Desulfobacca sp.]